MSKIITAEQARNLRELSLTNFVENDMGKYVKYLNKKIAEAAKNGHFEIQLWCKYYSSIKPDEVISELSEANLQQLINHLEENGFRAYMTLNTILHINWYPKIEQPEPEVKEEPEKKYWYAIWK